MRVSGFAKKWARPKLKSVRLRLRVRSKTKEDSAPISNIDKKILRLERMRIYGSPPGLLRSREQADAGREEKP
jgi:hypothetical protein